MHACENGCTHAEIDAHCSMHADIDVCHTYASVHAHIPYTIIQHVSIRRPLCMCNDIALCVCVCVCMCVYVCVTHTVALAKVLAI